MWLSPLKKFVSTCKNIFLTSELCKEAVKISRQQSNVQYFRGGGVCKTSVPAALLFVKFAVKGSQKNSSFLN
jgi:hypothetical protein